uniref:Uncharacterized protein n=1 Tax=Anguilla anguilla TaxID=7936 RepID=A0A0E9QQF3_ANGAN
MTTSNKAESTLGGVFAKHRDPESSVAQRAAVGMDNKMAANGKEK